MGVMVAASAAIVSEVRCVLLQRQQAFPNF
jgi:hypothetical protein